MTSQVNNSILWCPKCDYKTRFGKLMWLHTTFLGHCKHEYILVEDKYHFCWICGG